MAHVGSIRGLSQYIKKIRAASTQEEREAIVQKELAKIREKYSSSKKCSAYDRKKYTWKLLYSHMMGYDVDFGHKQAADLIPSNSFDEKQVGYQALTILLNEEDEFMMLPVNNVLRDLSSRNEMFVSLSLCFAGSVAGPEMSAAIAQPVMDVLLNQRMSENCRKKAALCLLRIYRKLPEEASLIVPEVWCDHFSHLLATAHGTGMHLAIIALLLGVMEREGPAGYERLQPMLVRNLSSVIAGHGVFGECLYYGIPSPWLQTKYLRALALMPPDEASGLRAQLEPPLRHICEQTLPTGKSNQNPAYARTSILTEAAMLCLHIDNLHLLSTCLVKMTNLIERKDPNTRYIALGALCTLCESADITAALQPALPQVVGCLSDSDPAVKKRAIDLLVNVCDRTSVEDVSAQLLRQLPLADAEVRGELVVKVAILAERYAPSLSWYIQTMLALMDLGSEEVADDVWYRAVHAVAGSTADRPATTDAIATSLEAGSLSVPLVSTAGYVLSEFADQVPDRSPAQLAEELTPRLELAPVATQGLLLTALIKLRMHAPHDKGLQEHVEDIFRQYAADVHSDIQQRAVEYLALSKMADSELVRTEIFAPMPDWPDRGMTFTQGSAAQELEAGQEGPFADTEQGAADQGAAEQEGAFAEAAAQAADAAEPADGTAVEDAEAGARDVAAEDAASPAAVEAPSSPEPAGPPMMDLLDLGPSPAPAVAPPLDTFDAVAAAGRAASNGTLHPPPEHDAALLFSDAPPVPTTHSPPSATVDTLDAATTADPLAGLPVTGGAAHAYGMPGVAYPGAAQSSMESMGAAAQPPFPASQPSGGYAGYPGGYPGMQPGSQSIAPPHSLQPTQLQTAATNGTAVPAAPDQSSSLPLAQPFYQPPDMAALSLGSAAPAAAAAVTGGSAGGDGSESTAGAAGPQQPVAPHGHPLDSGAVLSTAPALVPSAANAPESQLSTFHTGSTGTQGMVPSGFPPQPPHTTGAAAASMNPFAAAASGQGGPAWSAGGTGNNPFAPQVSAPLDTASAAALMTPVSYSPDRDRMLYLGKGVLVEDSMLQIGYVAGPPDRASGSRTITLFCGNKHDSVPLLDVSISVAPSSAVPSIALSEPPATLQAQEQVQISVFARGVGDSGVPDAPGAGWSGGLPNEAIATICYSIGGQPVAYRIEVPLNRGSFGAPAEHVSQAAFFAAWGRLTATAAGPTGSLTGGSTGGGVQASGMARLPAGLPSGEVLSARMLRLGFSDGGMRLDPSNPMNYAGEAVLAGGVQTLVRVEVNPADYAHINVTVVCALGAVAAEELRGWVVGGLTFLALVP